MIPTNENVGSFTIDHTNLQPGIYIARDGNGFRTFDIRVTAPNKEPAMDPNKCHTLVERFLSNIKIFTCYIL